MQINFTIQPLISDLTKKFGKIPARVDKGISRAIKKTAFLVEGEAKKLTPVDTGRLRSSIFTTIRPTFATVQPKTNYAIYVHEGTSRMKARPYMKDAAEKVGKNIDKIFAKEIKIAIE